MEESLTKTIIDILLAEPFFGHLAARLLRQGRDDVPDVGLILQAEGTIVLGVNPVFWRQAGLTDPQKYGAVKHELLHLALQHPFRKTEFPRPDLYSVAADLVVNQYLSADQLREGQISLSQLSSLPWAPHQGVAYYYRQLENLPAQGAVVSREDRKTIAGWLSPEHPAQQRHSHWVDALEMLTPPQQEALGSLWQHRLKDMVSKEATGSFYRLDEPLRELIRRSITIQPAALDWKRALKMFATNSRKMMLKDTIRRPSKRYGTVPGTKIRRHQKLLVALDTSGSLQAVLLEDFFREIHHLWRTGAELTIVECDDEIRAQYPYRGQKILEVSGRGATAFDAPIRLANDMQVDGLIYLTDGLGPPPEVPPRMPMLWMISKQGIRPDSRAWMGLPGRVVKMN